MYVCVYIEPYIILVVFSAFVLCFFFYIVSFLIVHVLWAIKYMQYMCIYILSKSLSFPYYFYIRPGLN